MSYASSCGLIPGSALNGLEMTNNWDRLDIVTNNDLFREFAVDLLRRMNVSSHNRIPAKYDTLKLSMLCVLFPMYSFNANTCKDINNAHVQSIWISLHQSLYSYLPKSSADAVLKGRSARGFRKLFPKNKDTHKIRTSKHSRQLLDQRKVRLKENIKCVLSEIMDIKEITKFHGDPKVINS